MENDPFSATATGDQANQDSPDSDAKRDGPRAETVPAGVIVWTSKTKTRSDLGDVVGGHKIRSTLLKATIEK